MVFPWIPGDQTSQKQGEMWGAPHGGAAGLLAESDGGGGGLPGHGSTCLLGPGNHGYPLVN